MHPDLLLSGTRITESFDCQRRAVIRCELCDPFNFVFLPLICVCSARFSAVDDGTSPVMMLGTMLHELFDMVLGASPPPTQLEDVHAYVDDIVAAHTEDLVVMGETPAGAAKSMREFVPMLWQWSAAFLRQPADAPPAGFVSFSRDPVRGVYFYLLSYDVTLLAAGVIIQNQVTATSHLGVTVERFGAGRGIHTGACIYMCVLGCKPLKRLCGRRATASAARLTHRFESR